MPDIKIVTFMGGGKVIRLKWTASVVLTDKEQDCLEQILAILKHLKYIYEGKSISICTFVISLLFIVTLPSAHVCL